MAEAGGIGNESCFLPFIVVIVLAMLITAIVLIVKKVKQK